MKNIFLYLTALVLVLLIASCEESNVDPVITESEIDQVSAEAYADFAEEDINELVIDLMDELRADIAGGAAANGKKRFRPFAGKYACAEVTKDENSIVVDFGEGCENPDGIIRSGKILINFTDARHVTGAQITTTFEDYIVGQIKVEGTRFLTNISDGTEGQRAFEVNIENAKLTFPDESFRSFSGTKTRIWSLEERSEEVTLSVAGSMSGINRNGENFSNEITEELIYKKSCRQVRVKMAVSGVRTITRNNLIYTINYGDGDCDNIALLTLPNGEVVEVSPKGRG